MTAAREDVQAVAKFVRVSPRKARLVADHIRGRSVPEARAVLAFTSREAARAIEKVLHSAVSNAEANHGISEDHLFVKTAYVDGGPVLKRWRARARGRVNRILKRTCHITVKLDRSEQVEPAAKAPKSQAKPRTESKPKAPAKPRARQKKAVAS